MDANQDSCKEAHKGSRGGNFGRQTFNRVEINAMEQIKTRACYRCNNIGHLSRDCPMPPTGNFNRGGRDGRGQGGRRRGRGRC
jgi:hypothetical protein